MSSDASDNDVNGRIEARIEADVWLWMREFVATPSEFYDDRFAPCPFAAGAMSAGTVDVVLHTTGPAQDFIRTQAYAVSESDHIGTRVMVFAPRVQATFGLSAFVERLNSELIPLDVFCNTGVTKTMESRHPGSRGRPYFIVVANSLTPVLRGAKALARQGFYDDWPAEHHAIVVDRRARMAERYGKG